MNPSTAPGTSYKSTMRGSRHGSSIKVDLASASGHSTKIIRSIPIVDESSPSSEDINQPGQISPAKTSRRRSSLMPGNTFASSFAQSKTSPGSEDRAASRERPSKLVKRAPRRARTISQGEIARISCNNAGSSYTMSETYVASSSNSQTIPRATKLPLVSADERIVSTSRPSSVRRGVYHIYDAPPDMEMELSESSLPFDPLIAAHTEGNAELDLFPGADNPIAYARRTPTDTNQMGYEAARKHKRGISFDFMSLKPFRSYPAPPDSPIYGMKKRRSLRNIRETKTSVGKWAEPLSERQRALNVKRARKMAQVFGSEPPSALYQITNLDPNVIDNSVELIPPIDEGASVSFEPMSTSISFMSSRSTSVSSCTDALDCHEHDQTVDPQSIRPTTPPPFMTAAESDPHLMGSSLAFKLRRRRAAKLTHFFGVGYHDISTSMPSAVIPLGKSPPPPPSPPPLLKRIPSEPQPRSSGSGMHTRTPTSVEVDIKMSGRTGLWGIVDGRRNMKEADMGDVINKLREMKAK